MDPYPQLPQLNPENRSVPAVRRSYLDAVSAQWDAALVRLKAFVES
jgi:hypothetical protein